jgi:DNA-binding transcriptional MocR family regulator
MNVQVLSKLGCRTEAPPISWLMATALARPVKELRAILKQFLPAPQIGQTAQQYGTTAGDQTLRRLTAGRLRSLDGQSGARRAYSPDRLIITNGSQQVLYMITEALCDPEAGVRTGIARLGAVLRGCLSR